MDAGELVRSSPLGFVVAFGGGILSFLSPCVLPLVPSYLSMMSGVTGAQMAVTTRTDTARLLRATLLFVAGFTVVFVALGAAASAAGQTLQDHRQALNHAAGVVIIVMGLFLAGFVSPRLLQQERRFHLSPSSLGAYGPPLMGMAFAFGWTPCIGAILAPVLTLAATQSTLGRGIAMLFAYSLGLGVPFVICGVAFARLTGAFAWVKRHFRVINLVSGLLLAGFGVLLLTDNTRWVANRLIDVMEHLPLFNRLTTV